MIKLSYIVCGGVEFSIETDGNDVEKVKKIAHKELKYLEESYFRMLIHEKSLNNDASDDTSSLPLDKNVHNVEGLRFHETNSISMHQ